MKPAQKRSLIAVAAVCLLTAACAKKNVAVAPPPPATAAIPAPTPKTAPPPARTAATRPPAATTPSTPYPNAVTRARIDELLAKIEDAYFDYDKAALRPDALKALQADSAELRDILKDYPDYKLTIEGHCDERHDPPKDDGGGQTHELSRESRLKGADFIRGAYKDAVDG